VTRIRSLTSQCRSLADEIPHPQDPACGGKPVQPDWPKLVALVAPPKHGHGPPAPQMTARAHAAASTTSAAQMQQCAFRSLRLACLLASALN